MTHHLRDLIDAVTPPAPDGVVGLPLGPHAAQWVSSAQTIITETMAEVVSLPAHEPVADKSRDPSACRPLSTLTRTVLKIVREMPAITTYDVTVALRRRRGLNSRAKKALTPREVSSVLCNLERSGKLRGTRLVSQRDIKRAGGTVLWEAA